MLNIKKQVFRRVASLLSISLEQVTDDTNLEEAIEKKPYRFVNMIEDLESLYKVNLTDYIEKISTARNLRKYIIMGLKRRTNQAILGR